MELLDIVDEEGRPTGRTRERALVHRDGDRHRTSHVWLARLREGRPQLLLQKRSPQKDSHPGCYDISSAGHIPAGCGWEESALRELEEELGLTARADQLHLCGVRHFDFTAEFHGQPFHDNQVSRVYLLWRDVEPGTLRLQASEVSEAVWMDLDELCQKVAANAIPHCIRADELEMVRRGMEETRSAGEEVY